MEHNEYQKAIEQLVAEGYIILQVVTPNRGNFFFAVYMWQEGYFNTAQSIDFNTVEGVNITDFLYKNASRYANRTEFISAFNKVMDEGLMVRCEFTKNSTWYKWSSPNGVKKR